MNAHKIRVSRKSTRFLQLGTVFRALLCRRERSRITSRAVFDFGAGCVNVAGGATQAKRGKFPYLEIGGDGLRKNVIEGDAHFLPVVTKGPTVHFANT